MFYISSSSLAVPAQVRKLRRGMAVGSWGLTIKHGPGKIFLLKNITPGERGTVLNTLCGLSSPGPPLACILACILLYESLSLPSFSAIWFVQPHAASVVRRVAPPAVFDFSVTDYLITTIKMHPFIAFCTPFFLATGAYDGRVHDRPSCRWRWPC